MITVGIDIGSTMTKAVLLRDGMQISHEIMRTGASHKDLAHLALLKTLKRANVSLDDVDYIVGTGYGRLNIPFADKQITEITCHGKGIAVQFPTAKTVIEIGGQDCKAIRIENGKVVDFAMNEKCAAGTGRFLQMAAEMLNLSLQEMNELALQTDEMVPISNTCAIFAQQEIIAALSSGVPVTQILAGLFDGFSRRVVKLAQPLKIVPDIVLTGGGSKHIALQKATENILDCPILIPDEPFLTGAYGAAILATERAEREGSQKGKHILSCVTEVT